MRTCSCATRHGDGSFRSRRVSWVFQGSTEGPWESLSTWESGPCSWRACSPVSMFDSADLFSAESLSAHILKPFGPLVFAPHILKPFALGVRRGKMEMWFECEQPWWFFHAKPLSCIAHLLAIRRSWLDCTEEDTPGLVCCGAPKWVPNRCDSSCRTFAMGKGPCSRDPRRSKSNRPSACVQKRYLPNHRTSFAFSHMLCSYVYCIVYSMFIYPHAMYPQGPYTVYPDLYIYIYIYTFCIHIGCTHMLCQQLPVSICVHVCVQLWILQRWTRAFEKTCLQLAHVHTVYIWAWACVCIQSICRGMTYMHHLEFLL